MPKLTFYYKDGACSFVPHALLRHLSIPFEPIPMRAGPDGRYEAADGSFTHAEYLSIHSSGYVPALAVDNEVVTETPAVLAMIARLAPDKEQGEAMLGRTPLEKARVVEWSVWLSGTLQGTGFAAHWRPYRYAEERSEAYPAIEEKGMKVIEAGFKRINDRLKGKRYAVGESLTAADFHLYLFWRWGYEVGIPMAERYSNYGTVLQRVEKYEGLRQAIRDEGLKLYFDTQ